MWNIRIIHPVFYHEFRNVFYNFDAKILLRVENINENN